MENAGKYARANKSGSYRRLWSASLFDLRMVRELPFNFTVGFSFRSCHYQLSVAELSRKSHAKTLARNAKTPRDFTRDA